MQAHHLESERHAQAVRGGAADHRQQRAPFPRPLPEQTAHEHPEKRRLKAAEREHVDLPDDVGRNDGQHEYDRTHAERDRLARARDCALGGFFAGRLAMIQVDILDNGRRRSNEQGRHRGNRRRDRA